MKTVKKIIDQIYEDAGIEYYEHKTEKVEKSRSLGEIKKEIVDRAIDEEPGAYDAYVRVEKNEKDALYKAAKTELSACMKEYNKLLEKDVHKVGETDAMGESRIWLSNPDLWLRMDRAQRFLNDQRR